MNANSLAAFTEELPKLSERETAVLKAFDRLGFSTDREIMQHLGFTDMNAVRPRITALIQSGLLVDTGMNTRCPVTGKRVRRVMVAPDARKQAPLF